MCLSAPAAAVVRYDNVRYNLTPVMEWSPYVGKGPEVDDEWEKISRGEHHHPYPFPQTLPPKSRANTPQSAT